MTKTLWLGLNPPAGVTHYPMIQVRPLAFDIPDYPFTHVIFTSKTAVELMPQLSRELIVLAVGQKTAERAVGFKDIRIAENECAEGIIDLLEDVDSESSYLFYPHSKRSRPLIADALRNRHFKFIALPIYDVILTSPDPKPDLGAYEKVVFTSPSCVDSFFNAFCHIPKHMKVECIGPITEHHLTKKLHVL
jgi:uroporphyrinogen-III synthase